MLVGEGVDGQFTARGQGMNLALFKEFMRREIKEHQDDQELKDAFRVLDEQGDGYITPFLMQQICKKLGEDMQEHEVDEMIQEAISNYDGKIYYDGFVKTMIAK